LRGLRRLAILRFTLRKMNFLSVIVHPFGSLIPGKPFWPYFAGAVVLFIGLAKIFGEPRIHACGIDRAVVFGPLFLAIPMAVFGVDHFIATSIVTAMIPSWIPGHLFWAYFIGVALILAALSIVTRKQSALAATLLSAMIFSFVLLIHLPNLATYPRNRILLAVLLRDSSFSGGALSCALAQAQQWPKLRLSWITALVRYVISVTAVVFGVEHFFHPHFVPVVPLKQLMPSWILAHLFLAYLTGAVLIVFGLSIAFNWKARLAATWLGIAVFVIVLLVYLPITVANLSDIGNGLNYLVDTLAFSGSALLLAGVLPIEGRSKIPTENRGESTAGAGVFSRDSTRTEERL
jgi:uncharacterized membrane protein